MAVEFGPPGLIETWESPVASLSRKTRPLFLISSTSLVQSFASQPSPYTWKELKLINSNVTLKPRWCPYYPWLLNN